MPIHNKNSTNHLTLSTAKPASRTSHFRLVGPTRITSRTTWGDAAKPGFKCCLYNARIMCMVEGYDSNKS